MLISGLQPFTLLDFPGRIAAIVFTAGCNFRCGYCHNPEFVLPERIARLAPKFIRPEHVLCFLSERKGLLDGVVISGGEPTMQIGLPDFIRQVRALGFAVKLDTNGSRPEVVRVLLAEGLLDYVAMDYKIASSDYDRLCGKYAKGEKVLEMMRLLREGGAPYEVRTTLIKEIHAPEILEKMGGELRGVRHLYLQSFRPDITLDPDFSSYSAFTEDEMRRIAERFRSTVECVTVRA